MVRQMGWDDSGHKYPSGAGAYWEIPTAAELRVAAAGTICLKQAWLLKRRERGAYPGDVGAPSSMSSKAPVLPRAAAERLL